MQLGMIVIGIIESSKKRITSKFLKEILFKSNYKISYENSEKSITILRLDDKDIMIFDIEPSIVNSIESLGLEFDILIHTFLDDRDYNNQKLKGLFRNAKNIIINSDEINWTSLLEDNKAMTVTYGFNNKATINPSSYNIHYSIEANICFQREIITMLGKNIEPFEIPMKIGSVNKRDLYSGMAILACGVILDIDIILLKKSIEFNNDIFT